MSETAAFLKEETGAEWGLRLALYSSLRGQVVFAEESGASPFSEAFALRVAADLGSFLNQVFVGRVPSGKTALSRVRHSETRRLSAQLVCVSVSTDFSVCVKRCLSLQNLRVASAAGWGPVMLERLSESTAEFLRKALKELASVVAAQTPFLDGDDRQEEAAGGSSSPDSLEEGDAKLIDSALRAWKQFCEATVRQRSCRLLSAARIQGRSRTESLRCGEYDACEAQHLAEQLCAPALADLVPVEETAESLPRRRGLQPLFDRLLSDAVEKEMGSAALRRLAEAAARTVDRRRKSEADAGDSRLRPLTQFFLHTGVRVHACRLLAAC